jgi:hypothetical protein
MPFVELRAHLFRQSCIRRIAHEAVGEGEGVLARHLRIRSAEEVAAHEPLQLSREMRPDVRRRELGDLAPQEHRSDNRGALDHDPLVGIERVEPRSQQRLDGRGQANVVQLAGRKPVPVGLRQVTLVDEHPEELLEEERVALGALGHNPVHLLGDVGRAEDVCDELARVVRGERLERDVSGSSAQGGVCLAVLEQVGPGEAAENDREARAPSGDVLEQVEKGRLRPLDIFEHDDHRLRRRKRFEQSANGPEDLLRQDFRRREAEHAGELLVGPFTLAWIGEQRANALARALLAVGLAEPCGLPHELDNGPEARPLAIGGTAAAEGKHVVAERIDELLRQAALADAGRAEHQHQRGGRVGNCLVEECAKSVQFVLAADDRRVESPHDAGTFHPHVEEAKRRHREFLAFEGERVDSLDAHRVAHQAERLLTDQDLAVSRRLLEALRRDDGVAGHECVPETRIAPDHLAGVDSARRLEAHAELLLDVPVEILESEPHLGGRADRANGVVFVCDRMAEDAHDRVADELLHRSAVTLEHSLHLVEVAGDDVPQRFWIVLLGQRRRAGEIGEENRHDLPDHQVALRCLNGEFAAARRAEPGPLRVFFPAFGTCGHVFSVRGALRMRKPRAEVSLWRK